MDLFSEVYGCYYSVVARILESGVNGLSRNQMERVVSEHAFYESAFYLLPQLLSGKWDLLEKRGENYYSKVGMEGIKRPLTLLEKRWLKALLSDSRMCLFISSEAKARLERELLDVEPLYYQEDFHDIDVSSDGDNYLDEKFQNNFRVILEACKGGRILLIQYEAQNGEIHVKQYIPYKLNYSSRDDKFRLMAAIWNQRGNLNKVILNLHRIQSVNILDQVSPDRSWLQKTFEQTLCKDPIVLKVFKERNALERCMLQFASWKKHTEFNEEEDCYICKIYYDKMEETELLIRILSFGPVVKVLGPEGFLQLIKERIQKQCSLNQQFIT